MLNQYFIFLTLPLVLSAFTHLWNPIGFPISNIDEGIYLGRAIYFLDTFNPKDPYNAYYHPYFGQIFLAALLTMTGYQSLFNSAESLNYEMIWLVPRIFMGILAIVDTFLIFKIGELRYGRNVAFIASILFAVMPLTWLTRWILLDSLQLPLTLLSVFLAILCFRGHIRNGSIGNKDIILVLLSGTFLGLSIFTKIPSFTMIPLVAYLVFTQSKRNLKILGLWFIPVLLIPMIWPMHSIIVGEYSQWLEGINAQTHRESQPLHNALEHFFKVDPIMLIIAIPGLLYAGVKRDSFILLSIIPFLIFMYFIGYVVVFHLLSFMLFSCISSSKLFYDAMTFAKKNHLLLLSAIGGILAIVLIGLTSTTLQIVTEENSQLFKAARFADQYLEKDHANKNYKNENNSGGIARVSHPFFFWIDKYRYNNENNYYWSGDKFQASKLLFIIEGEFKYVIEHGENGKKFRDMFSAFNTRHLMSFRNESLRDNIGVDVLLTDLRRANENKTNVTNALDENYKLIQSKYVHLQRGNGIINLTADTTNAKEKDNVNTIALNNAIDLTGRTAYLSASYVLHPQSNETRIRIEIKDSENQDLLWRQSLRNIFPPAETQFFILPENISGKKVSLELRIDSHEKGIDSLILKNLTLYH